jgi:hypothetical protein
MKFNGFAARTKLFDEPLVQNLFESKYNKSNIQFVRAPDGILSYYSSGIKRNVYTFRNSSDYYDSPNFLISVDKNNLAIYNNSSFVFIDELSDCLYVVDGIALLQYLIDHIDNVKQSNRGIGYYILIPKKDVSNIANTSINYNKQVSDLIEINRDEKHFKNLF